VKSAVPSVLSYGPTGMVLDRGQALMDNRSLSFRGEMTRSWSDEQEEIGYSIRSISYSQSMEHSSNNSLSSLSVTGNPGEIPYLSYVRHQSRTTYRKLLSSQGCSR